MATKLENGKWDLTSPYESDCAIFFAIPNKLWLEAREKKDFSIVKNFVDEHFIYTSAQIDALHEEWEGKFLGDKEAGYSVIDELVKLVE